MICWLNPLHSWWIYCSKIYDGPQLMHSKLPRCLSLFSIFTCIFLHIMYCKIVFLIYSYNGLITMDFQRDIYLERDVPIHIFLYEVIFCKNPSHNILIPWMLFTDTYILFIILELFLVKHSSPILFHKIFIFVVMSARLRSC